MNRRKRQLNWNGVYICHFISPLDIRRLEVMFAEPRQQPNGVEWQPPLWLRVAKAFGFTEAELRQLEQRFTDRPSFRRISHGPG